MRKVSDDVSLTEVMTITNTGRVGIGTASPDVPLNVVTTNASAYTQADACLDTYSDTTTTFSLLRMRKSHSDTMHNVATTGAGTYYLGALTFQGNSGTQFCNGIQIEGIQTGAINGTNAPSRLRFRISNDDGLVDALLVAPAAAVFLGSIAKASGTFNIRHPDPVKSGSMMLNHSFVESPTAGDNLYTFVVSASADNQTVVTDLPDYWQHLNENPRMWIQAQGKFAQAYGEVSSSLKQMKITMEKSGSYDVLLIGTRKDIVASASWAEIGGVETLISGSRFEDSVPGDTILSASLGL